MKIRDIYMVTEEIKQSHDFSPHFDISVEDDEIFFYGIAHDIGKVCRDLNRMGFVYPYNWRLFGGALYEVGISNNSKRYTIHRITPYGNLSLRWKPDPWEDR